MRRLLAATVAVAAVAVVPSAMADGTETLGPPSVAVASGAGVVVAGLGTEALPNMPGQFSVTVPGAVKQVLLYWEGHHSAPFAASGDSSITINGIPVTGTLIGGPTAFFGTGYGGTETFSTYRADITALNLVAAGANTLTVTDMLFQSNFPSGGFLTEGNDGVGVMVVYDDGSNSTLAGIRDGSDLAYKFFASPLDTTVAQTFTFAPSINPRSATLSTMAGSVKGDDMSGFRGSVLRVTFDVGAPVDIANTWQSNRGYEFDAESTLVTIPAGASSMTVQALSEVQPNAESPASFAWIAAALSVPNPAAAALGDFVWNDLNNDGIQNANEPGVAGVVVNLYDCAGNLLSSTVTDATGIYAFTGLAPGGYRVEFVLPSGYVFSPTDQGADDAKDSDANTTTGMTGCYTLAEGETNLTVDAGLFQPSMVEECPSSVGGVNLGGIQNLLFFFENGSKDANWQAASKGFVGNVAVDGIQANERTSGSFAYAGTISTNDTTLSAWQRIVDNNPGQAAGVTGQVALINGYTAALNAAFAQINAMSVTAGFANRSATSLNGLNTQNGVSETFVINVTSGFQVSTKINITGDAGDVFVLRWDTDSNFANGYQGQVKFQSGGAIVPKGGLTPGNFIHVAGDINASGGGTNPPPPYPQGPRLDEGQGALITGASNFNGGGFFTGYWLTTGDPAKGFETASLSNAIFVGGWYTTTTKFSLTSGTSGVHVCPPSAAGR